MNNVKRRNFILAAIILAATVAVAAIYYGIEASQVSKQHQVMNAIREEQQQAEVDFNQKMNALREQHSNPAVTPIPTPSD